jgi:hypothetical protein
MHQENYAVADTVEQAARLVVLEFEPRWTISTIDIYGEIGPGWILGPERDYPVIFQEYKDKHRIDKLRDEIAALGGKFYLKPDLDEQKENPLIWREAALSVPVADGAEYADRVAFVVQSISLAAEQSGLFTTGSIAGIRNPKQAIETVARDNSKPLWRQKWRGSWRGGELLPSNKYG